MAGQWELRGLGYCPHCIRPETNWFHETRPKVRDDRALWFSLQLTPKNAKDLYDWDLKGDFGELIEAGAQMTRTGRTALKFALDMRSSRAPSAPIFSCRRRGSPHWRRCGKPVLSRSPMPASRSRAILSILGRQRMLSRGQTPTKFLKAVPSLSRSLTMESVSRTIAFARGQPRRASSIFLIWR